MYREKRREERRKRRVIVLKCTYKVFKCTYKLFSEDIYIYIYKICMINETVQGLYRKRSRREKKGRGDEEQVLLLSQEQYLNVLLST